MGLDFATMADISVVLRKKNLYQLRAIIPKEPSVLPLVLFWKQERGKDGPRDEREMIRLQKEDVFMTALTWDQVASQEIVQFLSACP